MKFPKSKLSKSGFTLIELLVVVAIISLLSSIVLAGLREARQNAIATAYRQEVDQFIKALELYYTDKKCIHLNKRFQLLLLFLMV